ncbi:MAG: SET domain-containing protein-lysine N-methyltransferase [Gammaproteobacteria bacterium]|nr:SET domain-containing protein-lysine N-methyltransferase [Gammaproteobacteria bacterium]
MYPESYEYHPLYPKPEDFEIIQKDENSGFGVISRKAFKKGELIAAMNGERIDEIRQHSLQIEPGLHLYDIHFSGYFLHSCSPNVHLDMQNMLVSVVRDIKPGDYILMDYAQTEDVLYHQFPCSCGAANCRGWITGRREAIDESDPMYQQFVQSSVAAI